MNFRSAMRLCVVSQVITFVILALLFFLPEAHLPTELQRCIDANEEAPLGWEEWISIGLFLPGIISYVVGLAGLNFMRRWGAILYLLGTALLLVGWTFSGPIVEIAVADLVISISSMLDGAIISLIFVSRILKRSSDGPIFDPSACADDKTDG